LEKPGRPGGHILADIRDIRDLLGHESVSATEIYTHVSTARQKRVVSLLEK